MPACTSLFFRSPCARRAPGFAGRLLAALAVAAWAGGCSTPDAQAPAATSGARWSTVALGAPDGATPQATAAESAREREQLKAARADAARRAGAARADLVWDLGARSLYGNSPVIYADPALALPKAATARVRTINLTALYEADPRLRAHNLEMRAAEVEAEKTFDRMSAVTDGLVEQYRRLVERGDRAGSDTLRKQIETRQDAEQEFARKNHETLLARGFAFRDKLRKELIAETAAAARARGVTVVLDASDRPFSTETSVVFAATALIPAAGGGMRDEPAPELVVRTVDIDGLYDRHPATLEFVAQVRAENEKEEAKIAPLTESMKLLEARARQQEAGGDRSAAEKTREQSAAVRATVAAMRKAGRDDFGKRNTAQRAAITQEIGEAAAAIAERAGATLLLNTGSLGGVGRPFITYSATALDITEAVARELGIATGR